MWIISFWVFPIVAGCVWIGKFQVFVCRVISAINAIRMVYGVANPLSATLVAMLGAWAADGKPHYTTMSHGQTIP